MLCEDVDIVYGFRRTVRNDFFTGTLSLTWCVEYGYSSTGPDMTLMAPFEQDWLSADLILAIALGLVMI